MRNIAKEFMNLNSKTIETINPWLKVSKGKDPTLQKKQQEDKHNISQNAVGNAWSWKMLENYNALDTTNLQFRMTRRTSPRQW